MFGLKSGLVLALVAGAYVFVLVLPGSAWAGAGLGCGHTQTLTSRDEVQCVFRVVAWSITSPPPCIFINGGVGVPQQGVWPGTVVRVGVGQTIVNGPSWCKYSVLEDITVPIGVTATGTYNFTGHVGACTVTVTLTCLAGPPVEDPPVEDG
jgi:hypothetical protein